MHEKDRLAPLAHPLFWTSLAVLLLNDHVLKGAGVLPAELTGKLSDFAGLIVAPVLIACLFGARTPKARFVAFASVVGVFAATNLSSPAARLLESIVGALGVDWRIWTDPTDLVALSVLPLAWWLASTARSGRSYHLALSRSGAVLSCFACVATSQVPEPEIFFETDVYLSNTTDQDLSIRVRWLDAQVNCEYIEPQLSRALHRDAFGPGISLLVDAGAALPLNRLSIEWETSTDLGVARSGCEAVLLQADGLDATILYWRNVETRRIPVEADPLPFEGNVVLRPDLTLEAGPEVLLAPYEDTPEPSICERGTPSPVEWSAILPSLNDGVLLRAVEPGTDGCLGLHLSTDSGEDKLVHLCVPAWAFPFAVGTTLSVEEPEPQTVRLTGEDALGHGWILIVGDGVHITAFNLSNVPFHDFVDCEGERRPCGVYAAHTALRFPGHEDPLLPGEVMELTREADGRDGRFFYGAGPQSVVVPAGCDGSLGWPALDGAVLYREEM